MYGDLKDAVARLLPQDLIQLPKMGFSMPVSDWFRGDLRGTREDLAADPRLKTSGFLDPSMLKTLWWEHLAGARSHARPVRLRLGFAGALRNAMTQGGPIALTVANARR